MRCLEGPEENVPDVSKADLLLEFVLQEGVELILIPVVLGGNGNGCSTSVTVCDIQEGRRNEIA